MKMLHKNQVTQVLANPFKQGNNDRQNSPSLQLNQLNQFQAFSQNLSESRQTLNGSKQLGQTSQTCISNQNCPSCSRRASKISYYSCCLSPNCKNCYSGFHYLECPIKNKHSHIKKDSINQAHLSIDKQKGIKYFQYEDNHNIMCHRCQQKNDQNSYFKCKQCNNKILCQSCLNVSHKTLKFSTHSISKYKDNLNSKISENPCSSSQINILNCQIHKKPRNILAQNLQLLCQQCHSLNRLKKLKQIDYISVNSLPCTIQQIKQLSSEINSKYLIHKNRWQQLHYQLKQQYNKICKFVNQKFQLNSMMIKQIQDYDMKTIEKAMHEVKKAQRQSKLNYAQLGICDQIRLARLNILVAEIKKTKISIQFNEMMIHKVNCLDDQKIQTFLKGFSINKIRQKQSDDKENMSVRKSYTGNSNVNPNNLSVSRRSFSKSISKIDNPRNSMLKQSRQNLSNTKSQNISQQMCTQPVRNSTPPHYNHLTQGNTNQNILNKMTVSNSEKKSALLRQNSLMNAKIEDITPVMLNFDLKESNGSRINFLTNKAEQQNLQDGFISGVSSNNISQSRNNKKKSDYFQLRDRMRKPNIVSNRFTKR